MSSRCCPPAERRPGRAESAGDVKGFVSSGPSRDADAKVGRGSAQRRNATSFHADVDGLWKHEGFNRCENTESVESIVSDLEGDADLAAAVAAAEGESVDLASVEAMALFAPNANSFRRITPTGWVPLAPYEPYYRWYGRRYTPLFPYFASTPNAFRVLAGDFPPGTRVRVDFDEATEEYTFERVEATERLAV